MKADDESSLMTVDGQNKSIWTFRIGYATEDSFRGVLSALMRLTVDDESERSEQIRMDHQKRRKMYPKHERNHLS